MFFTSYYNIFIIKPLHCKDCFAVKNAVYSFAEGRIVLPYHEPKKDLH